jgi:choline dehydrogenase-like flavoprotein
MNPILTRQENRLTQFLKLLFFVIFITLFFHLLPNWEPAFLHIFFTNAYTLLAGHSLLQAVLIMLLLFLVIGDVRRFSAVAKVLIWFLAGCAVWSAFDWIKGRPDDGELPFSWRFIIYGLALIILWLLVHSAAKARYGLKFFSAQQFETLRALAEVCVAGEGTTEKMQIEPLEVAFNVEHYMTSFEAKSKWIMKLVLTAMEIYPMLTLNVPLSLMQPHRRLEFLRKRFLTDIEFKMTPAWYQQIIQAAIRMSKQLCFMGYYSDKRVYESIGYVPFEYRKDIEERKKVFPVDFEIGHSKSKNIAVLTEETLPNSGEFVADVVIAGSGAGASILAHQLIQSGRKVLLVERGNLVLPSTYSADEVKMVSRLYQNGALQLSRDFRFQVFQGSCVGGSTVVNNAVCFDTPDYILDRWINEMGIGLDRKKYEDSMKEIYRLMRVSHTPTMTVDKYLNPGGRLFADTCRKLGYTDPQVDSVMANIEGCMGCGYCNMGCKYGRKLSMLDTILPEIQMKYPDQLQIIAGCEAMSFNKKGNRIVSMTGQFNSGKKLIIKGNTFISSAGAISSSILLIKSKLGIANAGKRLGFNLGSQITAAYPQVVNSYDGLQISHYLKTDDRRYVMETWFNPPMFQSTAMPGWFDQHFRNMKDYNKMACTGVLVGTASNAEVRAAGLLGRDIRYVPTQDDFSSLMDALEKTSEVYLHGGAERVMPNTFDYFEYKTIQQLKENLKKDVKSSKDISTGTGHPQGGNVISNDPKTGVVDEHFKVFGFENLYVCDASVFPTTLGVNPQITVMALAHYAAEHIV